MADTFKHRIRKIDTHGVVSTIAGSGESGFEDGQSGAASFHRPSAVAVDQSGNVLVADTWNHRIRRIGESGAVSTFAGTGEPSSSDGMAADASFAFPGGLAVDANGNVLVADTMNHLLHSISVDGVVTTPAGRSESFINMPSRARPSVADPPPSPPPTSPLTPSPARAGAASSARCCERRGANATAAGYGRCSSSKTGRSR